MEKENVGLDPAFTMPSEDSEYRSYGLNQRKYAAIKLQIPDSGEEWLDEMIRKKNRRDAALLAMQGILANASSVMVSLDSDKVAKLAFDHADELLKQENE